MANSIRTMPRKTHSMGEIPIRPLRGTDLNAVLAIWNRALIRDPINEQRFVHSVFCDNDYIAGEDSGFFVATEDDRPIGFLRAIVRRWPNDRVGVEPDDGWIPVVAVDPVHQRRGIGTALLNAALDYFKTHQRKRIWVCGRTGSAAGYVFCGVDKDAYPGGLRLFENAGFVRKSEPVAMSREITTFDVADWAEKLSEAATDIQIASLRPEQVPDFLEFLASEFPGDWNIAARGKIKSGGLSEILVASKANQIVGYCQWEGEHFGPFGVSQSVRNQNVGARLFIEAIRRIRAADGRTAWFNWADEKVARFYRRFGFHATRRFAILTKDL